MDTQQPGGIIEVGYVDGKIFAFSELRIFAQVLCGNSDYQGLGRWGLLMPGARSKYN